MGFFDKTLENFGYERQEQTKGIQNKDYTTSSGALGSIVGANSWNPAFSSFNNERQQLLAYRDWVYIAARAVAEQCAAVDLRLFEHHTNMDTTALGLKLIENPKQAADYFKRRVNYYETKNGVMKYHKGIPALEEIESNPLLTLMNHPNPYMVKNEFLEITFLHLELTGNAYWFIARDKKKNPVELWPLLPNGMAVVPDKDHFVIGYVYTTNGRQIPLDPHDVVHHKYGNPMDFRHGYSAVMAGSTTIDADTHASIFNQRFFYNSAMPDGFLTTDDTLDEKSFKRLKTEWMNTYGGAVNSHRTAILSGGLQYKNLQIPQRDMEFLQGRNFNRDMIMALFGVPKSILGFDESMSRANADTAEYVFTKRIRVKMQRLTNRVTMDLAPQFAKNLILSFTDPVPEDKAQVLDDMVSSLGGTNTVGFATPNEVRAKRGDLPVPGGDEVYIPLNMQPMGQANFELKPQGTPADAQEDPGKPEENDDDVNDHLDADEDGADDTSGSASAPGTGVSDSGSTTNETSNSNRSIEKPTQKNLPDFPPKKDTDRPLPNFPESSVSPKSGGEDHFLAPETAKTVVQEKSHVYTRLFTDPNALGDYVAQRKHTLDIFEVRFLRVAKGRFTQQKSEVLYNIQSRFMLGAKTLQKANKKDNKKKLDNLFDGDASKAAWASALIPVYKGATTASGSLAASLLNKPAEFGYDAETPETSVDYTSVSAQVDKYFVQRANDIADNSKDNGVDNVTNKMLRATLNEGINAGESIQQLVDRVENVYGANNSYRALRIATTESARAMQYANNAIWADSGIPEDYIWKALGSNPCPICIALNNTIHVNPSDFPTEHINGHCAVIPNKLKALSDIIG